MNAQRGKSSAIEVYHDEDMCTNKPNLPVMASSKVPAVFRNKTTTDFAKQGKRMALAEIVPTTNASNVQNQVKFDDDDSVKFPVVRCFAKTDELVKPENKFFKYKRVEVPNAEGQQSHFHQLRGEETNRSYEKSTIWSPLRDSSFTSGPDYSPMMLDQSRVNDENDERLAQIALTSNTYLVPEYATQIYSHLLNLEVKMRPKSSYMKRQPDITSNMRTIVVDWLVEVCEEYKLETETLYLAISYLDRFLSSMSVVRSKLQLVGTAALFIASKYEEIYPPDLKEFVYITDTTYTKRQVLRMEHLILEVLAFDLTTPTAHAFLERLIAIFYSKTFTSEPKRTADLSRFLCELTLLDGDQFLCYLPSQVSCAAFALAKYTMGQEPWSDLLIEISGYEESSFGECYHSIHALYAQSTTLKHQAIRDKYKSPKFNCVSLITPPQPL